MKRKSILFLFLLPYEGDYYKSIDSSKTSLALRSDLAKLIENMHSGKAFLTKSGLGSDANHFRPLVTQLNSTRGSKSFDEVFQIKSNIVQQNGSTNYKKLCYTACGLFYPGVGYRGAATRNLMYMQTR